MLQGIGLIVLPFLNSTVLYTPLSRSRSPSKKVKAERDKQHRIDKPAAKEDIPSTSSFIRYVLQKGANNRDMDLVRKFERPELCQEESASTANTATESESDWESNNL